MKPLREVCSTLVASFILLSGVATLVAQPPSDVTIIEGTISVLVETFHDGFKTVAETRGIQIKSGDQPTAIDGLRPAPRARLTFTLATPESALRGPLLSSAGLAGDSKTNS